MWYVLAEPPTSALDGASSMEGCVSRYDPGSRALFDVSGKTSRSKKDASVACRDSGRRKGGGLYVLAKDAGSLPATWPWLFDTEAIARIRRLDPFVEPVRPRKRCVAKADAVAKADVTFTCGVHVALAHVVNGHVDRALRRWRTEGDV